MTSIQLKGFSEALRFVKNAQKQVAYAASKAINRTAIEVQNHEVSKELPKKLKLRSAWFKPRTRYGVNIKFSNKTRLFAKIGSQAPWLTLVEHGGIKRPPGKFIPVPTSNIDTSRRRRRSEKPRNLGGGARTAFVITLKSGKQGLAVRLGPNRYPIKVMYLFHGSTDVKDILDFFESGKNVVQGRYISIFGEELAKAIATVK